MKIAIVKYNAGNIQSVLFALERLGIVAEVSDEPEVLRSADKVIFPGVGEASTAMGYLRKRNLHQLIPSLTQPVLGICLGLQLLCQHSEENDIPCLGVFDVQVRKFNSAHGSTPLKVPQIGWNAIKKLEGRIFDHIPEQSFVYFVHSYYAELSPYTTAQAEYGCLFSAALYRDNFFATQFHPEKSGSIGAKILENFIKL